MMKNELIHPRLLQDCHVLGQFELCYCLLNKNAMIPWFILVPINEKGDHYEDYFDLEPETQEQIMDESQAVVDFIKESFPDVTKINYATIGNVVPQLHFHIIGRHPEDVCWPKPVWGHLDQHEEYDEQTLKSMIDALEEFGQDDGLD